MTGHFVEKKDKPAIERYLRDPDMPVRDQIRDAIKANPGSSVRDIAEALALPGNGRMLGAAIAASINTIFCRDEISRTRGFNEATGKEAWLYYPAHMGEFRFSSSQQKPERHCIDCNEALPSDLDIRRSRCDRCQDAFMEDYRKYYHRLGNPWEEKIVSTGGRGTVNELKIFVPDDPPYVLHGKQSGHWKAKKDWIWTREKGRIPADHRVLILDEDPENVAIDNLVCVPENIYSAFHKRIGKTNSTETGRAKLAVLQTEAMIRERRRELNRRG